MPEVRHWRYCLPSEKGEGYAIIFIDSRGVFSAVSDYGNYGYWWSHHGCRDIREFVMGLARDHYDYPASKFQNGRPDVYNGHETLKRVKEAICRLRRDLSLDQDVARAAWDLLDEYGNLDSSEDFARWLDVQHHLSDAWELAVYETPRQIVAFCQKVLPRLAKLLRAELESEGYFATEAVARG